MATVQVIPAHVQFVLNLLDEQEKEWDENFKKLGRKLKNPQKKAASLYEMQEVHHLDDGTAAIETTQTGCFGKEPCLCRMAKEN